MNTWLSDKERQRVRQEAATAEKKVALTPAQLEICFRNNWFNLFVPRSLGGLEMTLPEALRLEETLAELDGSLGWTLTLCAGAAWFAGFLDPALAKEIFSDPKACIGGSGAATGTAKKEKEGYRISGQWRFATGAPHLTYFTASCQLTDEQGVALFTEEGSPQVQSFIFKKEEVDRMADWRAVGLIGTGSHSFRVKDLWIAESRSFQIDPKQAKQPGALYQYPFLPFAAATLSVNYYGMVRHFLTLAESLFAPKKNSKLIALLEAAREELNLLKNELYAAVHTSWEEVAAGKTLSAEQSQSVNLTGARLADAAIRHVDFLFPYCGMTGADTASDINRVWRDLHTASQHGLLRSLL